MKIQSIFLVLTPIKTCDDCHSACLFFVCFYRRLDPSFLAVFFFFWLKKKKSQYHTNLTKKIIIRQSNIFEEYLYTICIPRHPVISSTDNNTHTYTHTHTHTYTHRSTQNAKGSHLILPCKWAINHFSISS